MRYVIYATNDAGDYQRKVLKAGISLDRANEILADLIDNDYMDLTYELEIETL